MYQEVPGTWSKMSLDTSSSHSVTGHEQSLEMPNEKQTVGLGAGAVTQAKK